MCGTQFTSGHVVADMLRATENYQVKSVSFIYFESHDSKCCSDSIGSIVKHSFTRGMLESQEAVCNFDDILAVIQNKSKQSTKKFHFCNSGKSWMVSEETSKLKVILQIRWHHGFTFSQV